MRLRGYPSRQPSDAHLAVLDIDGLHQRVELLRVKVVRALPFPAELVGYLQASQRSIASIGKQMKTAESSYRLAAAGVKDFDKSAAGLTAKLTLLQEKLGLQQKASMTTRFCSFDSGKCGGIGDTLPKTDKIACSR